MKLDDLKYAQRQRLIFLDRCLTWRGAATRRDLMDRFRISNAQAAIDFRTYLQMTITPPVYDAVRKAYVAAVNHQALAPPDPISDFEVLANAEEGVASATVPQPSRQADPVVIARLHGAIKAERAIHIRYTSMTTGVDGGQWIAPTRFTSDGENVHLRGFSFKHKSYRDYLPMRIDAASSFEVRDLSETLPVDEDWHKRARIWLRPKIGFSHEQAAVIRREYGFSGEFLLIEVRKALEFYILRRWRLGEEKSRLEVAKIEYDQWIEQRVSSKDKN